MGRLHPLRARIGTTNQLGRDAFHRVRAFEAQVADAVERVPTWFMGSWTCESSAVHTAADDRASVLTVHPRVDGSVELAVLSQPSGA